MTTVMLVPSVSWWLVALCLCVYAVVAIPAHAWDRLPVRRYLAALGLASLPLAYLVLVDVDCNWWWWCCIGVICLW